MQQTNERAEAPTYTLPNGSATRDLAARNDRVVEALKKMGVAVEATMEALEAVGEAAPHMRDFYPDRERLLSAREAHDLQVKKLQEIQNHYRGIRIQLRKLMS